MNKVVDIRALDEWLYQINEALCDLEPGGRPAAIDLLRRVLDDMRERRAHLLLRRRNEKGY